MTRTYDLREAPAEIRNRIYEYAVTESEEVEILRWIVDGEKEARVLTQRPGIIQACRQTRFEATPAYFANNSLLAIVRANDFCLLTLMAVYVARAGHAVSSKAHDCM